MLTAAAVPPSRRPATAKPTVTAVDLFCGAGGTSSGLRLACQDVGARLDLLAVNHWDVAIATHSENHPEVRHMCVDLEGLNPREVVPSGRLKLLVASPECIHHSIARGGRPMNDQSRASAWHVLRWAEALYIENILVENVREFRDWGPLGANGRPLPSRKGETYRAFLAALTSLGYRVDDNILNAADYGDATTRQRLFVVARRGGRPVRWPAPTHSATPDLFNLKPWVPAKEVIDWTIPGKSIFGRKKPMSPNTLARIAEGLRRFGGKAAEPFIVQLTHGGRLHSVNAPLPTITTANRGEMALCEPFLLQQQSGGAPRSVGQPVPTVATAGAIGLVQPFLISAGGPKVGPRSVDQPMNTVLTRDHMALVTPFLVPFYGERAGQKARTHSIEEPVPTLPASPKFGLVRPFLAQYNGTATARSVDDPLPTVTGHDRFGLVVPEANGATFDIHFRMLQPQELARAMSFGDTYQFKGTKTDHVRQIGNAVPVQLARALCRELIR